MTCRRVALALVLSSAAAPLVTGQQLTMPRVEVHAAEDEDFTAFKTYGWKDPVRGAERPEVHTSIVWYTERSLEKKGLEKVPDGSDDTPDLYVRYYAKAESSVQGTPSQRQQILPGSAETISTTTSFDFQKARAGSLILELQKPDNTAVWRAGTDISRIDERHVDAEVERAVRLLFAKYPPKK